MTPFWAVLGGYHDYFAPINGNVVNFFNSGDYALATGTCFGFDANWEKNHQSHKPDTSAGQYSFDGTNSFWFATGVTRQLTNSMEKKAMVARTRTAAVGATSGLGGVIQDSVDLETSLGFGRTREEHSAQFTRNIQSVRQYYQQTLRSLNIEPAP